MTALNHEYAQNGKILIVKANLKEGFDQESDGYVFDRNMHIEYKRELKFWCHLRLKPKSSNNETFRRFLADNIEQIEWNGLVGGIPCSLSRAIFSVQVNVNDFGDPISMSSTDLMPTLIPRTLEDRLNRVRPVSRYPSFEIQPCFLLNFYLSRQDKAQMTKPLVHEKFEHPRVISGGRPESDRRKF